MDADGECINKKIALAFRKCDTFKFTSYMQLQDGTTYNSNIIIYQINKKSINFFKIKVLKVFTCFLKSVF